MSEATTWEVLRGLIRSVYVPTLAAGLATGMLIPVLPLYLRQNGLSFTAVSAILAAGGVGSILGAIPSGILLTRMPERRLLIGALLTMGATAAVLGLATAVLVLFAFRLAYGIGWSGQRLAVQTYVTRTVRSATRGRAMANIGGSMRIAFFVGPLAGGALVDGLGYEPTFLIIGSVTLIGVPGILRFDPGDAIAPAAQPTEARREGAFGIFRHHQRTMITAAFASALVITVRDGRHVVLPLIAHDLGLSPTAVGLVVAFGTGADLALFPIAGHLMDRHGRLFAMVPAFSLVSAGLVILALAENATVAGIAGVVMGAGNGISAGALLTLGGDLAPRDAPGPFLAGMATLGDSGKVLGPLVVGLTADWFGLSTSAGVLAVILAVAVVYWVVVIGETADHRRPESSDQSVGHL